MHRYLRREEREGAEGGREGGREGEKGREGERQRLRRGTDDEDVGTCVPAQGGVGNMGEERGRKTQTCKQWTHTSKESQQIL